MVVAAAVVLHRPKEEEVGHSCCSMPSRQDVGEVLVSQLAAGPPAAALLSAFLLDRKASCRERVFNWV